MEESHHITSTVLRSELETQQKRVRHLRKIVAKNLEITDEIKQKNVFFTIYNFKSKKVIYTSETVKLTQNPTWKSFYLPAKCSNQNSLMMTSFNIKLWLDDADMKSVLIDWTVDLTGLMFIGEKVQYDGCSYPANSLLFAMHDGFYGVSPEQDSEVKYRSIDAQQCSCRVDNSLTRHSYTTSSLLRIQTVLRAIKQTQAVVKKVRDSIEGTISQSLHTAKKQSEREILLLRVHQLRNDLEWNTMQLQTEKEAFEIEQTSFNTRGTEVTVKFETLQNDKERHQEKRKIYFEMREELIKTSAQLVMRRKQLISELAFIYPICEMGSDSFSVSGVKLPNSEEFSGHDEVMIAVALGYTSHLVQMISHFLDVPVRYPMEQRGSRSRIRDHIHDKLTDKERDFPLYSKGKEKFQFNYGVYLMNKNIAQLRYYCGLGTTDLRITLPNLKTLLELRLGVKFDAGSGALILDEGQATDEVENPENATLPSKSAHINDSTGSDSNNIEVLQEQKAPTGITEDIFTPANDTFFQVKPSASSSSLSDGFKHLLNTDTSSAEKDNIITSMDTQNNGIGREYPSLMSDPTFIVNNTYDNSYGTSRNEISGSEGATFKTVAMQIPESDGQPVRKNDTETNMEERTALLTNVSSFKPLATMQDSESYEE